MRKHKFRTFILEVFYPSIYRELNELRKENYDLKADLSKRKEFIKYHKKKNKELRKSNIKMGRKLSKRNRKR